MAWQVYKSTNGRADLAICDRPVVHQPLQLSRMGRIVELTPIYIQELPDQRLRVVSGQITLFLREVDNG